MDKKQITPALLMQADNPEAGITVNFLVIASLLFVVVVTGLVCAAAAAVLALVR